jgi:hypothetical protein
LKKRFLYNFSGTILIEAENQKVAEKLVAGRSLNDYVINENIYETEFSCIAVDPEKRKSQFGTPLHPIEDYDDYQEYKLRKHRYSPIFNQFLHGKIDRQEMMKNMEQAESKDIPYSQMMDNLEMWELKNGEFKTVRIASVGDIELDID